MEKSIKIKYWVDLIMFIFFLLTALTGLLSLLFGESWVKMHVLFAIPMTFLVVIHLLLHKDWISFTSKKIFHPPTNSKQ